MCPAVTMEDLIEEIVGDLDDELERDDRELTTIDERTSVVEGQIRLEDVNEQLDLHLPDGSGVDVAVALAKVDPPPHILVLSASGERQDVLDALTAGATGYLVKSASIAELLDAVRRVAVGDAVFTPGLAGLVLGEYRRLASGSVSRDDPPQLTERETEVLRLVAKGLTYPQIAERLVLSVRTVQNHVQNTLTKLQLHNKAQLVRYAMEQGLSDE